MENMLPVTLTLNTNESINHSIYYSQHKVHRTQLAISITQQEKIISILIVNY